MTRFNSQVLSSVAEIATLGEEWDVVTAPLGTPLLDHDWFLSAAECLHEEANLRVVVIRDQGRLAGVAPMAVSPTDGHLILLGTSALFEPSGWAASSEDALRQLAIATASLGEVAVLDRVSARTPLSVRLPALLRGHAFTVTRQAAPSLAVNTRHPIGALTAQWSSRTRRTLEAARQKAERTFGAVQIERLHPTVNDAAEVFEALMTVEVAGWKGAAGSALAHRPALARFFGTYARRAAEKGHLRVTTLRLGGTTAAMELAVEAYGSHWGLKIAYDERFASCSPALILLHESIVMACQRGLAAFEFLGSAESWQARWKPERREYALMAVYPFTRRAMTTAIRDVASHLSRRVHGPQVDHQVTA